jgi:DNA-directed RNA polymerase specialized sigma24 family protein
MAERSPRPRWTLTGEAFEALLDALDTDRARAGERYELLRQKLVRFFEWRGARDAEDWADETLNRVARRIEGGEAVRDVAGYAAGPARMVWLEVSKKQNRDVVLVERAPAPVPEEEDAEHAARLACLDRCLESLAADQRDLVLEYFAGERGAKIDRRKQIAARLGVEMNALRIRVHRIRGRLELCVKECVASRGTPK